ncbi:MAG: NADH-quinone oxidoreductase subunit N [Pseudomonadales bacterium]
MMELLFQGTLPMLVLAAGTVVLMLQIAFWRNYRLSLAITAATFLSALLALISVSHYIPINVTAILVVDKYSVFFSALIILSALVTLVVSASYLQTRVGENEEFFLLLILSTLGALVLVHSAHLASFLLGLELMGVALYALIAYPERGDLPLEAAIKYLVLSGAASAVLLFGFALLYAAVGTLSFEEIGLQLKINGEGLIVMAGTAMILVGAGFKLSLVPFHMWTPDVYQGAPAPVTGFLASVSKAAVFAALLRFYLSAGLSDFASLTLALSVLAMFSMIVGNLLALRQLNIKRLLAYSSIAHMGYLLISLILSKSELALEAAAFYLAAYMITTLAAFTLIGLISCSGSTERDHIDDIKGLFWRSPVLAGMFTLALLSLAGIPLTAGFIGKVYIFSAGVEQSAWPLLWALIIGSAISIYYYVRLIFVMTLRDIDGVIEGSPVTLSFGNASLVVVLSGSIIYLGIFPQTFIRFLGSLL